MTTQVLSPAEEAFAVLSSHCAECPDCRPDPERPETKAECPRAASLYRAWWNLWTKETRS